MNKTKLGVICMVMLALLTGCGTNAEQPEVKVIYENEQSKPTQEAVQIEVTSAEKQYVVTAPGVTTDMLSPDYWMYYYSDPDSLILDETQIKELNEKILADLIEQKHPAFDLNNPKSVFDAKHRDSLMKSGRVPKATFYKNGEALTKEYWQPIVDNMNTLEVKADDFQYGIAVRRSDIRVYPTMDNINDSDENLDSDEMQNSGVLMNEPLLIVHTSKDGQWYYVFTKICAGWIEACDVALCRSVEEWNAAADCGDFIVFTGNSYELCVDDSQPEISRLKLYMGTKLTVVPVDEQPEVVGRRYVYDNYVVKVPVKGADGYLGYRYTLVPVNADISFGYLPYTGRNLLNQMFKCSGDRYGWGGMNELRDCSEYTNEVYRCFGIELPRNSTTQGAMSTETIHWDDKTSVQKKYADLDGVEPGAILRLPGHVMFYLGKVGEEYYVISATGSFDADKDGEAVRVRTTVVNSLEVLRPNGKSWAESITDAKIVR